MNIPFNAELAADVLTRFVHNETTKVGFKRAVIGLSGGIDSAVSLVLTVNAPVSYTHLRAHET